MLYNINYSYMWWCVLKYLSTECNHYSVSFQIFILFYSFIFLILFVIFKCGYSMERDYSTITFHPLQKFFNLLYKSESQLLFFYISYFKFFNVIVSKKSLKHRKKEGKKLYIKYYLYVVFHRPLSSLKYRYTITITFPYKHTLRHNVKTTQKGL